MKTLLIDEAVAYVGSVCLADSMASWRDLHVRLTGAAAVRVAEKAATVLTARRLWQKWVHRRRSGRSEEAFEYQVSQPRLAPNPIYQKILHEINRAQGSVRLVTPYFLPPFRLRLALHNAVRRGVSVQVMMPERTDVPASDCVARSYLPALLKAGVEVLFYQKAILHAKYVLVDSAWATVGSTNMDYLSLLYSREANIFLRDRFVVEGLVKQFDVDAQFCRKATLDDWYSLPLRRRLFARFARLLHKVLHNVL